MLRLLGAGALLALFASAACDDDTTIDCDTNADCIQGGIPGVCLASPSSSTNWCAFTDTSCPAGQRWGAAAGDGLQSTCVAELDGGVPDAGPIDAMQPDVDPLAPDADPNAPDAMPPADASPNPSKRIVVATALDDTLQTYSAANFTPIGDVTLPDRVGTGNKGLYETGGLLYVTSQEDLTAVDPATVSVVAGFPKHIATTLCSAQLSAVSSAGMFCLLDVAATDNTDAVKRLSLETGGQIGTALVARPQHVAADGNLVAVVSGLHSDQLNVFNQNLVPIPGSPLTVTWPSADGATKLAVSDHLGRVAASDGSTVKIYDGLAIAGTHTFTINTANDLVSKIAFDAVGARLLVLFNDGRIGALSTEDASVVLAPVSRASKALGLPAYDASRGRFYFLSGLTVVVLDSATLAPVSGSPANIAVGGNAVSFF